MKKLLFTIILLSTLISCNRDESHIAKMLDGKGEQSGIVFQVQTKTDDPIENIHIYGFDEEEKMVLHEYYSNPKELASNILFLEKGWYTFIEVLNVGGSFRPPASKIFGITLSEFVEWVKEIEPEYSGMLTGIARKEVKENSIDNVYMDIRDKAEGTTLNMLSIYLTLPNEELTEYIKTKNTDYTIRVRAEAFKKGTDEKSVHYTRMLDGSRLDLDLKPGEYEILLWADHVLTSKFSKEDYYYNTTSLQSVTFNSKIPYTGVDSRDAFSISFEAAINSANIITEKSVTLERPFAKYSIKATDIEKYNALSAKNNKYPPLEKLTATISYEGFFPNTFNVSTSKPINAVEGLKYNYTLQNLNNTNTTIGSDYVFVNGDESFVNVTVTIADKKGNIISQAKGVRVDYRLDHITTVSGDFLTAGVSSGGVTINTEWDDEVDHNF